MGANFDYRNYVTSDVKLARDTFINDMRSDRIENGNSYSGTIGMLDGVSKLCEECETREEAMEWLLENTEKWEEAKMVSYKNNGKTIILIGGICSS